jgi:hypothetical protein
MGPWRNNIQDTSTNPPPPNHHYDNAIKSILTIATEDIGDIYMTFISVHVQPLAHIKHWKHFTVSLLVSFDIPRTPPTNIPAVSPVAISWTTSQT